MLSPEMDSWEPVAPHESGKTSQTVFCRIHSVYFRSSRIIHITLDRGRAWAVRSWISVVSGSQFGYEDLLGIDGGNAVRARGPSVAGLALGATFTVSGWKVVQDLSVETIRRRVAFILSPFARYPRQWYPGWPPRRSLVTETPVTRFDDHDRVSGR